MTDNNCEFVNTTVKTFENITKKPETFLSVQRNVSTQVRGLVKNVYDFTKNSEDPTIKLDALPELIIQDFDEEQIWQQIELQNDGRWARFLTDVSKLITNKDRLIFPIEIEENKIRDENGRSIENGISKCEEQISERSEYEPSNSESEPAEEEPKKSSIKDTKIKTKKGSIVDDKFFKLNDLEKFLDVEDRKAMQGDKHQIKPINEGSETDDSDESVDLFDHVDDNDFPDDDEDYEEGDEVEDRLRNPRFKDFFDAPDDSNVECNKSKVKTKTKLGDSESSDLDLDDADLEDAEMDAIEEKRVRFNFTQNKSDSDTEVGEKEPITNDIKSTFEVRQQRLAKKIGHLEKAALGEKPWQLKGEVNATNRPQNSLLEEFVEFDLTSRPAPIITEETTVRLEDIIKQRIKDKVWDDVERKIKPVDTPTEYKKKLVMDQEKSKVSLAQVYEQEYIKQKEALEPDAADKEEEDPKEHIEIREMMTKLFSKLDALSNFHYTPKPAAPEVRIISNLPAISIEEVAPVATSDATLLAPEEIKGKSKGDIVGKAERTFTDKNRERRQKKIKQRVHNKEREDREKVAESLRPGKQNKYSKEKAKRLLEKVSKDRNVEKMEITGDGKSIKSSTAFFTQLQEEVNTQIKSKKVQQTKNKKKEKYSAKLLKL